MGDRLFEGSCWDEESGMGTEPDTESLALGESFGLSGGWGITPLGWAGHGHMTAAIVGWVLFLLVETAPMLWTMLLFTGVMMALSRIFPPVALIFIIIGIVFFILRIRYVIQNAPAAGQWVPGIYGLL